MKKLQAFVIAVGTLFAFFGMTAPLTQAASNGLGITPRKDYTIQAGQQISDTLYLNNLSTTQALSVSVRVIDFTAANDTGTPALQLDPNAPATPWSLKPFITLPASVTVPAGKSTTIPMTIRVPVGQGPGSYYSAVEYTASGVGNDNQVNVAAAGTSLIFVTVEGKATENLQLVHFGAFMPSVTTQTGTFSTWFLSIAPKELAYVVKNQGNIAEQPDGSIVLRSTFGHKVTELDKLNPNSELALIGQTRRFTVCLRTGQQQVKAVTGQTVSENVCENPKLTPGRYTATLTLLYGANGNPTRQLTATTTFWYIPLWFIATVILGVAAIVGIIHTAVRRRARTRH